MTDAGTGPKAILDTKELEKLASTLLEEVQRQKEQNAPVVVEQVRQASVLFQAAIAVGRSHSGSNFGYHSLLYYKNFQIPALGEMFDVEWGGLNGIPPGWTKREPEEVRLRIEKLASGTFASAEDGVKAPLRAAKKLHKEILIRLSPLHQLSDGNRERQLLDGLEHFDWQDSAHQKYAAQALKNSPNATRDSGAFSQGLVFPAHSYYEAAAYQVEKSCDAVQEFWNSAERLLRQLQAGSTQALVTHVTPTDGENFKERYERLKKVVGILAALLLSFVMAGTTEVLLKWLQWKWLLAHPNSYSILGLSYAVLLLFLVGLFVRKYRKYCWGFALLPLLVAFLQSLGGPPGKP